jgi:hypothetical protein
MSEAESPGGHAVSRFLLVAAIAGVLFGGSAVPAPRPKDEPVPPDYYPAAVGTVWVYDMNNGNGEQVRRVSAVEDKDGAKVVTLEERGATRWIPAERAAVSPSGVRLIEFAGHTVEPYVSLKYPVRAGDTWDFDMPPQVGLTGYSGTVTVLGEEVVEVPAGKFKAVKVERILKTEDGKPLAKPTKITVWFAEGVGRVKVSNSAGCELALKSFTRGR